MNKKTKVLATSIATIAMTASLAVGGTYALFTSEDKVNIAVTSGKVEVTATIDSVALYSMGNPQTDTFANGGTAKVEDKDITLTNVTPGDKAVVALAFENKSTVTIQYRMAVTMEGPLAQYLTLSEVAADGTESTLATGYTTWERLTAGATPTVEDLTFAVELPENIGNEAQGKTEATTISVFVEAVQGNATVGDTYITPAAMQEALDKAEKGTVIQLAPNVNYGTLYLRPSKNNTATKEVDWIGNNYRYETYTCFEDLTIIGAAGATVDAFVIEGGTYFNAPHSQFSEYPIMLSLIELKNVTFDGVTFTGNGGYDPQGYGNAINLSGNNIKANGLTLKNCVLENPSNNARLLYKTEGTTTVHKYAYDGQEYTFSPSLKDITVTGCTLNGGYMGMELRETENLTITNNTFKVANRNILLPTNTGCVYSGTITITGNVSENAKERFVRGDMWTEATVVIANNTINNYQGADDDYIKVTGGQVVDITVENNVVTATAGRTLKVVVPTAKPPVSLEILPEGQGGKLIVHDAKALTYLTQLNAEWDKSVSGYNSYYYKWQWDIELAADIDFNNATIETIPINGWRGFNGNNYTISNVVINGVGLFDSAREFIKNLNVENITVNGAGLNYVGSVAGAASLENVHVNNATVTGAKYVGGLVGGSSRCIANCSVKNSTITASGKTAGGLVGYAIEDSTATSGGTTGCTVENVTVTGAYNVGGLAGQAQQVGSDTYTVANNTIKNVTVISTSALPAGASTNEVRCAEVAARIVDGATVENNTVENVVLQQK